MWYKPEAAVSDKLLMKAIIQATNLTRTFSGGTVAVNGLDMQVEQGSVYGLIGRNGAGKTTLLRMLMGLLHPDRGEGTIFGECFWQANRQTRSRVAYVSQAQHLPAWMTLTELARCTSAFYPRWDSLFFSNLTRRWELPTNRALGSLSGGEQRKAAVLLALASQAEVLLLDEPGGGLDPISRRELINEMVGALNRFRETTILFSTHYITDLERIADTIGILDRGRLIVSRSLDDLQSCFRRVQVIFPGERVPPRFSINGAKRCVVSGPVVIGVTEFFDAEHLEAISRWPGVRVHTFPLSLEDLFIEITGLPGDEPDRGAAAESETIFNPLCV